MAFIQTAQVEYNSDGGLAAILKARPGMGEKVAFPADASESLAGVGADGRSIPALSLGPNSAYLMGDSLAANGWITTGAPVNFLDMGAEGWAVWASALMGQPLNIIGSTAVGGKTAQQVIDEQLPAILAARPSFVFLSCGVNDLYVEGVTAAVAFNRITTLVRALTDAGIVPIWSTVWARSFVSSGVLAAHLETNDRLRRYVLGTRNPGLFWDGFRHTVDPASAQCAGRSSLMYDGSVHPGNALAYYLGKACAAAVGAGVPRVPFGGYGAEDQTNATGNRSNLLVNPHLSGSVAVGAVTGVTGNLPTSWAVDWATRTGTGTAAASIVDVVDPDSGLATARAIQLVLGGAAAAGDVLRITQASGFNTLISGGDVVQAECMLQLINPVQIDGVPMRLQCNTNESTWWALSNQTKAAYPEGFKAAARTRELTVLGAGAASAARFDVRINMSGAASGTIMMWLPRVRKVVA